MGVFLSLPERLETASIALILYNRTAFILKWVLGTAI